VTELAAIEAGRISISSAAAPARLARALRRGAVLRGLAQAAQEHLATALETMGGVEVEVDAVDVSIEEEVA